MRSAGMIAFLCAGLQGYAYMKSSLTTGDPIYCIASPFGACETIMASGYAAVLGGAGAEFHLAAALATFIPMTMWLTVVISGHNPMMMMRRDGRRKIAPAGWLYLALFAGILVMTGMVMKQTPPAQPERAGAKTSDKG